MNARKYHFIHSLALLMLFVIFFAALISSQILLRNARIDLTEKKLWTLSAGSIQILEKVQEPIEMKLFFSNTLAQQSPSLHRYSQRVRGLLLEIKEHTNGRVKIEYIDPEPFSEQEDRALSYGLRAIAVFNDEPLYFGLVAENRSNNVEALPSLTIERQHQLEYDLIHLIHNLAQKTKPRLGIVSSLPLDTGVGGLPAAMEGRARPFLIYDQLFANYNTDFLEQNFDKVPASISTLLIAHPKKLSSQTLYALDQFILRGGKALILLDPFCEISKLTNSKGKTLRGTFESSNLSPLLKNWGVLYDPRDIVADRALAQNVVQQDRIRKTTIERKYVLWLNAAKNNIAQDEIITAGLSSISLATSGFFKRAPHFNATWKPLISSSNDAMLFSSKYITSQTRTPDDLLSEFLPSKKVYVLAAKLSGTFQSAYKKKPPLASKARNKKGKSARARARAAARRRAHTPRDDTPHLAASTAASEIILVADSDLLEKRFWIDLPTYYRQGVVVPTSDNATFIINALDALMGNEALIELRARTPQVRSFTQVDQLRQQASQKLAAEEYRLRQNIQIIEARLSKFGKNPERRPEGRTQLLDLERELLATRRALHQVRKELNRSIEILGVWVKFFNILFVPLVLIMVILIYPWLKKRLA